MAEVKTENKAATTKSAEEKTATINIPLTRHEKGDVFVGVNGKTWLIKRGIDVEVPACVAEVLRHRDEMLAEAMAFEEAAANKAN